MKRFKLPGLFPLLLALTAPAFGTVPKLINFQGVLRTPADTVVSNGSYSVTFTIYPTPTGGINLWTETQSVTTSSGLFTVLLGATNPVPDSAFKDSSRYLGITVSPDPEMIPRQQLVSVGYGYRVSSVDGALGGNILTKVSIGPGHTNTGADAFVAGANNIARGNYSVVSGGGGPTPFDSNSAQGNWSTISGGHYNVTSGMEATVAGGGRNLASGIQATVGGGAFDTASNDNATVSGGFNNTASGNSATVSGGLHNRAIGGGATVGGGQSDTASGDYSTVGGGFQNTASALSATVSGGSQNRASNQFSTVGGGNANRSANGSTIGGGNGNTASGAVATVGGGSINSASNDWATIGGGLYDTASGSMATIGGGEFNIASGLLSTIGGGGFNKARGKFSVVSGGGGSFFTDSNSASGDYATVGGGRSNTAGGLSATYATVGGGLNNIASNLLATVGGGNGNTASGTRATVGGGDGNTTSNDYATVGGGSGNIASGAFSAIGGGQSNRANNANATVSGGLSNVASGSTAAVGGGTGDTTSGTAATVPGGSGNKAAGDYSFAAGRRAKAIHAGAFVWADSNNINFASSADAEFNVRASGGTRIYSNSALTAGVTLAAGASAWVAVSDSNLKRNIRVLDGREMLEKVMQLPIKRWSYKAQDPSIEHIGPMAQDFYPLFQVGDDEKTISTIDPPGIALAAIQGLYQIVQEQKAENKELRTRNENLSAEMKELKSLVQKLLAKNEGANRTYTLDNGQKGGK